MASPVRLRGSVGERLSGDGQWYSTEPHVAGFPTNWNRNRRQSPSIAARVDEIIKAVREEEGREQAKLLTIIAELRAKVAGLEGRNAGLQEALAQNSELKARVANLEGRTKRARMILKDYRAQEGSYDE